MDRNMIMQVKENVNGRIQLVRYMYVHVKLCHLCIMYDIFNFKNMWTIQGRATGNKRDVLFQFSFSFLCIMAERQNVKSLSRVQLFATPWTVAYEAPLSMEFSRQQYWSGLPFPFPGLKLFLIHDNPSFTGSKRVRCHNFILKRRVINNRL